MKVTKAQLKEMVKKAVKEQLNENANEVDSRMSQLDNIKHVGGLSTYELLEDILEQLDSRTWKLVLAGLKHKYGFKS